MKKKKIVGILVCMLIFTTFAGAMSSANISTKSNGNKPVGDMAYSHTILGEYGTYMGCEPCKYAHRALKRVYAGEWHPFYYITFVYDKNTHAFQRIKNELGLIASPTVYFDGGYDKKVGGTNVETEMARYNASIIACGNRDVADIDLSLDVEWLGAVNNDPKDGATDVSVDGILNWTNAAIDVEVTIDNNEASTYDGHLHVYVTEINSTMWNDKFGDPYTFEFKSYAFNEDITISAGGTWDDSAVWDGEHQTDGHGTNFTDVLQSNIMVIASVFDDDTDYTDETAGVVTGVNTDPKTYDVYFGNSTPPPKIASNIYGWTFAVGELSFDTTYYWKIDVWDNQGNPTYGDIWSFTTRGNEPPNTPSFPFPPDNVTGIYIDTNLSWACEDPDGDDVSYDIYFGTTQPPPMIESNYSGTMYDLQAILVFNTKYFWRIVAWDTFDYMTSGPNWSFTTQANLPPNKASDPHPEDGANNVPGDAILNWTGNDPNPGDILIYDVYFGVTNPPGKKSSNQSENSYDPPGDMELHKKYYWRINTWDSQKLKSVGDVWSFTIGINHKPDDPTIDGETSGTAGEEYEYTFISEDQDGDNVSYYIEWRDPDGNITDWTPFQAQGSPGYKESHSWPEGTYTIRAKAKDIWGYESGWSYLEVTHPKIKAFNFNFNLLNWLFERFPNMFPIIRNLKLNILNMYK